MEQKTKVYIASDHAGYVSKSNLIKYLESEFNVIDLGTNSTESVDYNDFARKLAMSLQNDFGILICKTGVGMSIAINRYVNVRGALCKDRETAILSREHNNANVLILSSDNEFSKEITVAFLTAEFSFADRHVRRVKKLSDIC